MTPHTAPIQKLALHPSDPVLGPVDRDRLLAGLRGMGLIATPFEFRGGESFLAGPEFPRLLTFLGCSPHLLTDAVDQDAAGFYCLSVAGPFTAVRFVSSRLTRPPACPHCKRRVPEWRGMISAWGNDTRGYAWNCPDCGSASRPEQLNWRQKAGFGRLFVEVHGVFPGEAVPADRLMAGLREISGSAWRYFYYQE